jgi:hypothetical protein
VRKEPIIGRFVPQIWINGYAVNVDPEDPDERDVTEHLPAIGEAAARRLRDDDYPTDNLRTLPNVPAWPKEWPGPFYVAMQDRIAEYFSEEETP